MGFQGRAVCGSRSKPSLPELAGYVVFLAGAALTIRI
jgi:hypothetical protein